MARRFPSDAEELLRELGALDGLIRDASAEFAREVDWVTKSLATKRQEFAALEVEKSGLLQRADETDAAIAARKASAEAHIQARTAEAKVLIDALVHDKVTAFQFIARAWADYELALAEVQASNLESKSPPAMRAAELLRIRGRELAEVRREAKLNQWIVALYEAHFPWLEDFRSYDEEESFIVEAAAGFEETADDPSRHWLSTEEWTALSAADRNQKALERYLRSRQSPWVLGRDYERYVGFLREQQGYRVDYHGIIYGFDDLGRDVIAERDGLIEVIQCKRWAQHKEIHEKHVFQLFGTVIAARIENPEKTVTGTFTTTTRLSERARRFAEVLEIRVEENFPLNDYPRIKCNVSKHGGEQIYHLPFDQQYDSTEIEPHRGERYVMTCHDAEALGFRRAWRWHEETVGL